MFTTYVVVWDIKHEMLIVFVYILFVRELGSKMATEDNGNVGPLKPTSSSNEDLSEYTDADESISAPTEFLAEVSNVEKILFSLKIAYVRLRQLLCFRYA